MLIESKSYAEMFPCIQERIEHGDAYCYGSNNQAFFSFFGAIKTVKGVNLLGLAVRKHADDPYIPQGKNFFYCIAPKDTEIDSAGYRNIRFRSIDIQSVTVGSPKNHRTAEVTFSAGVQSQNCQITFSRWSSITSDQHLETFQEKIIALGNGLPKGLHDLNVEIKIKDEEGNSVRQRQVQGDRKDHITDTVRKAVKNNDRYMILDFNLVEAARTNTLDNSGPYTEIKYFGDMEFVKGNTILFFGEFVFQKYPDYHGLVYLMLERPINTLFSPSGAFSTDAHNCFRGFGFHESGGKNCKYVASNRAFYNEEELFIHELGHALWRSHAKSNLFATGDPGGEGDHIVNDTCIMNYDPDLPSRKFCGRCILEMRGWDSLPLNVENLGECKQRLEKEIDDTSGLILKAWKQMRRAFLSGKESNWDEVETWNDASLRSWTKGVNDWKNPYGLALLREALVGYKKAGKDGKARQMWDILVANTETALDRIDGEKNPLYP